MQFFNLDNPIMQFLGKVCDLIILNLLFMLCCLPIVTVGASLTAMYSVTLKMAKGEEGYIAKGFFISFKNDFKISTISWLIVLILGIGFAMNFYLAPQLFPGIGGIIQVILIPIILSLLSLILYLFPYIARFENTMKETFRNACLISIANFPYTILLFLINSVGVVLFLAVNPQLVGGLWMMVGFSSFAYLNSMLFRRIFSKYEPPAEEENTREEE